MAEKLRLQSVMFTGFGMSRQRGGMCYGQVNLGTVQILCTLQAAVLVQSRVLIMELDYIMNTNSEPINLF